MKHNTRFTLRILSACIASFLIACSFAGCGSDKTVNATTESEVSVTEAVETTAAIEPVSTEAQTAESSEPADDTTQAVSAEETTEAEAKKPETKAEIVALYNDAANSAKTDSKSILQNYSISTQTKDASISNKMLEGIANKLISANMGHNKDKDNKLWTTQAEKNANFVVEGQTWASKLTEADIAGATCEDKGDYYKITLKLVDDTTPNLKIGSGHAGKGISIVTKDEIVKGAGSLGMSVIEEPSIKVTYKNCKIVATIDKETGKLLTGNYYQDWTLALTALGIDVEVSFGLENDYKINW